MSFLNEVGFLLILGSSALLCSVWSLFRPQEQMPIRVDRRSSVKSGLCISANRDSGT
jgi:hypothetical protein